MSLATYSKKRNFNETPEPGAKVAKGQGANTFVIQRHNATRLHYDFRLEVNGVLKSWAIPKGPSLNPTDKRLAVMVEDHPLSYATFKGTIPEGNYGAGIVEIWDKGTYVPEEMENISDREIEKHINNGMLKFSLKGSKIKGSFALVRIKGADSRNWLLIKHRDKYATEEPYNSEEVTAPNSPINKVLQASGKKRPVKKAAGKKSAISGKGEGGKPAVGKSAVKKSASVKGNNTKAAGSKAAVKKSPASKSAAKKTATSKSAPSKSAVKKTATGKSATRIPIAGKSTSKKSAPARAEMSKSAVTPKVSDTTLKKK